MIIKEFRPEIDYPKNSVILADYRNVNYEDEGSTIQDIVADKYEIDLYPVMCEINQLVMYYLNKNYGDCVWYVDKSLMKYFR